MHLRSQTKRKEPPEKETLSPPSRQKTESTSTSPPPPRLYKHALESIFAFLNLPELARVSATSRDWSAAVQSMRPIGVRISAQKVSFRTMRNSRLTRHVSAIYKIQTQYSAHELSGFCDVVKQSKSLTDVDLSWYPIDSFAVPAITEAIGTIVSAKRATRFS